MRTNPNYGTFAQGAYAAGVPPMTALRVDGVLGRRFVAYLVDLVLIAFVTVLLGFVIGIVGLVTFGLGWMLYAVLVPAAVLLYSAATVGGRSQATIGMRMADLVAVDAATGGPVGAFTAACHALLFYIGAGTFLLLLADLAIALVRADRRMGHDLIVGLALVRRR